MTVLTNFINKFINDWFGLWQNRMSKSLSGISYTNGLGFFFFFLLEICFTECSSLAQMKCLRKPAYKVDDI